MMRRSSRLPPDLEPSSLAKAFRGARRRAVNLTLSNPTLCQFDYPEEQLNELFRLGALEYEPAPLGLAEARQAIARLFGDDPSDIVVTTSTSESYSYLIKLFCSPGDAIAVPAPGYPLLEQIGALEGVRVRPYRLRYTDRWELDVASLNYALEDGARMVIAVSPNNPTGSGFDAGEVETVLRLCEAYEVPLISDEVFSPYIWDNSLRSLGVPTDTGPLRVVLDGLSKRCALPQLKVGWMRLFGPISHRTEALSALSHIADAYLSVATPIQRVIGDLVHMMRPVVGQIRERVTENRQILEEAVAELETVDLLPAQGGWYGVLRVPSVASEEKGVEKLAREHGVLVHPGYFYDFAIDGYVVVSLLPPSGDFRTGVHRFTTGLRALG